VEVTEQLRIDVAEASHVSDARRRATAIASAIGFDATEAGRVAIVVTEAAGNLVKHAGGGQVLMRAVTAGATTGFEFLALDRGPGISDIPGSMRDGYSTAGSPGTGLGAVARLCTESDIYSAPGSGTVLFGRIWPGGRRPSTRFDLGVVSLPQAGQEENGDGWSAMYDGDRSLVLAVDGLGHGPEAALAARKGVQIFQKTGWTSPRLVVERLHAALKGTRGGSVAVVQVNLQRRLAVYCSVGNIAGAIITFEARRHMIGYDGTVGHTARRIREFEYRWPAGALMVLHSDGISSQWNLDSYPGLVVRHPGLVAGLLYRDFYRGRDDVTVVALVERDPERES
jgi:anti-sigma regulatory factor (Ser/Thr protein kinase)